MPGTFSKTRHIYSMHQPPNMALSIRKRVVVLSTVSMLIAATVILGSAYLFTLRVLAYQRGYDNATYVQPYVEPRKDYVFNSTTYAPPRVRRQAIASPMPEPLPTPLPDVTVVPPEAQPISASAGTSTVATIVGTTQIPESERRAIIAGEGGVAHASSSEEKNKSKESDEHSGERRAKDRSEEVEFVAPLDQVRANGTVKEFERLRQHPKDVRLQVVESDDQQQQRGVGSLEVTDRGKETSLLPSTSTTTFPTTTAVDDATTTTTTGSSKSTSSQESKESGETQQVQSPLKPKEDITIESTATTVRVEVQKNAGNEQIDFDPLIAKFVANRDKGLLFNPESTKFNNIVEFDAEEAGGTATSTTTTTTTTTTTQQPSTTLSSHLSTSTSSDASVSSQSSSSEEQATAGGFARGAVEGSPTTTEISATTVIPESTSHSPTLPSSDVLLARINPDVSSSTEPATTVTTSAEAGSILRTRIEEERRRLNQNQTPSTIDRVAVADIVTDQPLTTTTSEVLTTTVVVPTTTISTPEPATVIGTTQDTTTILPSTTVTSETVVDKVKEAVNSFTSTESASTTIGSTASTTTRTSTEQTTTDKSVMSKVADSISSLFGRGETTVLATESTPVTDSIAEEVDKLQHTSATTPLANLATSEVSTSQYTTTELPPLTDRISSEINELPRITTETSVLADKITSEIDRLRNTNTQVPSLTEIPVVTTEIPLLTDHISSEMPKVDHVTAPSFSDRISDEIERLQKAAVGTTTATTTTTTSTTTEKSEVPSTTQQPPSTVAHETQWYLGNLEEDHDRLKYFGARRAGVEPTTNIPLTGSTPVPVPVTSAVPSTSVPVSPGAVFASTVPPVSPLPHLVTPDSVSTVTPLLQSTLDALTSTLSTPTPLPHLVTPEVSSTAAPVVASGLPAVTPASLPPEVVTSAAPVLASGVQIATVQPPVEGATTTAVPVFASGLHAATVQPSAGIITPVSTAIPPITPAALTADNTPAVTSGLGLIGTTDTDYVTITTTPGAVSNIPATVYPPTGLPPLPFIAPGDVLVAPQNIDHETQSDQPHNFHHETEELKDPEATLPVVSKVTPNNGGNTEEVIKPSKAYPETTNAQAMHLKDVQVPNSHLTSTSSAADQVKAQATNVTQAVKNTAAHLQNEAAGRWSRFKHRWADSKEFVLANTGLALFVSLLQFISAAVLIGVVKDTMNEMKMHRWATRWIIFNWVLFIILICCFVSFIAMGSDPEKQFGNKLIVPENEASVRPDYPGIGFYTKSISSHMYSYLMLGDIVVLFVLMVMSSYILRNHTIHHIHLEHGVHH